MKTKLPERRTTWINTISEITDEPKEWIALPLLWKNEKYACFYDVDGEKRVVKINKD